MLEYNNRWKNLSLQDFFGKIQYTDRDANKGYYYLSNVDPVEGNSYMEFSEEVEKIPSLNKVYLKLLKAYFESKGARLCKT